MALRYVIKHSDSIDYSEAKPLSIEEEEFRVDVAERRVRFEFKKHFATEQEAREGIADYIRLWQFDASLRRGNADAFELEFDKAEIVDRNPTPGAVRLRGILQAQVSGSAKLTLRVATYPAPPRDIALDPDVETMHQRYMNYRRGREPLPSMAYFCLDLLERRAGGQIEACREFRISRKTLKKIAELSSVKGGMDARKAKGVGNDLSSGERQFLDRAVKRLIRRMAEKRFTPDDELPEICLSDLPPL